MEIGGNGRYVWIQIKQDGNRWKQIDINGDRSKQIEIN